MAQRFHFTVTDPVGLYASPTTELVDAVKAFNSNVTLRYGSRIVNLKSMMGVLSLGVPTKAELEICIEGIDEENALVEIRNKVKELGISV